MKDKRWIEYNPYQFMKKQSYKLDGAELSYKINLSSQESRRTTKSADL